MILLPRRNSLVLFRKYNSSRCNPRVNCTSQKKWTIARMKIAGGLPSSFMGSESFGRNSPGTGTRNRSSATDFCSSLDIPDSLEKDFLHHLPFVGSDTSVGCENELQAAVGGNSSSVDLPKKITDSIFYARLNEELPASIQTRQTLSGIREFLPKCCC